MTKLYAVNDNNQEPSRQDIAMAAVSKSWREWSPQGWKPIDVTATKPLVVDDVVTHKVVVVDSPIPLWRRILRRLRGEA